MMQVLWSGIVLGALAATIALCLHLIYKGTGVLNLGQGFFVVAGMYFAWTAVQIWDLPVALALVIAVLGGALLGGIVAFGVVLPVIHNPLAPVITTLAVAIIGQAVLLYTFGPDVLAMASLSPAKSFLVLGAYVTTESLWLVGTVVALIGAIFMLLYFTLLGRLFSANFQSVLGSMIIGVSPKHVLIGVFVLSGMASGLLGAVFAPIVQIRYDYGLTLMLKGFTAGIVGGLDRPTGAVAGGLVVGLLEAFIASYISSRFAEISVFSLVIVILYLRPGGIASLLERGIIWRSA